MSDKFCMSKNQIINVFKKEYHITPQLFSTLYKLDMAEEMLKKLPSIWGIRQTNTSVQYLRSIKINLRRK